MNNNTVIVIEKDALPALLDALTAAGVGGWLGTAKTLQQSATGDYVHIHDWTQCANPALLPKIEALLATVKAADGVTVLTEKDFTAQEKAGKYGILEHWRDKVGWENKKEAV